MLDIKALQDLERAATIRVDGKRLSFTDKFPYYIEALTDAAPALLAEVVAARAVIRDIGKVKAAQFGDMFWQCDAGPLEDLDDSYAAYLKLVGEHDV